MEIERGMQARSQWKRKRQSPGETARDKKETQNTETVQNGTRKDCVKHTRHRKSERKTKRQADR